MADAAPVATPAAPVAPTNGAHPSTPQQPATKPPLVAAPEVDDTEEYENIVDGQTVKVRLNKAQAKLHVQKGLAADKRFREAAEKERKAVELAKLWETDPEAALLKSGKDPEKFFAERMAKRAAQALKSPEQVEREKIEKERDEAREKLATREKAEADAKKAELDKQTWARLEEVLAAAGKKAGLPGDAETIEALGDIALEYIAAGINITGDQVVAEHQRKEREYIEKRDKRLMGLLSGKKLLDYVGQAALEKIKAAMAEEQAASLKDIPRPSLKKPPVSVKAHTRESRGYVREGDFDKKFGL